MDGYSNSADLSDDSPPSAGWLFAKTILERPAPRIAPQEIKARARCDRALLEWAAGISTRAEDEIRSLHRREAEQREAQRRGEQFGDSYPDRLTEWNEADHPRAPQGTPTGGQWVTTGGGGGTATGTRRSAGDKHPKANTGSGPDPRMLDLAHAWWHTKGALELTRRDLEELPRRIARQRAQLGSGGHYAYLRSQYLAKAERDLEAARALAPALERQLDDLRQEYHDAGYDDVGYSTFTPAETFVGGKGIEDVGRAVAMGGTPKGLQSTGIEFEIASAALAAPAILRLGKALLGKALQRAPSKFGGTVDDFVAKLPRIRTPTKSAANQYEIKHTGPYNYTISSGGQSFAIDGYRGRIILEAKHVGKVRKSPYVPGSSIRADIRTLILDKLRDDLTIVRAIIKSKETPFKSIEIITNLPEAKTGFEAMLKELSVPGTVRLQP